MPAITGGIATTFEAPNFVGELYSVTPADTPLLSSLGGLTGGEYTMSVQFQWQEYDLRSGETNRQRLEGQDAPPPDGRKRVNVFNVVEIHQESIETTYTKQAAIGQYAGQNISGSNPVTDEHAFQLQAALRSKALDIEKTFISGTYLFPADNATPRRTRGVLEAITTNVVAAGAAALTDKMVLDLAQSAYDSGGLQIEDTRVLMVPPVQKRWLTKLFITDRNYREETRTIGGVRVTTILTDFGEFNVMVNRHMPTDTLVVLSLEEMAPCFLLIPDKGFLFVEPLAKVGAQFKDQLYGEIGLKYGNERKHGKITGLATAAPPAYGT